MTWNYRVMRHYYISPVDQVEHCYFDIREVHYEADGKTPKLYSGDSADAMTDGMEDSGPLASLKWQLEKMIESLGKPILDSRDDFKEEVEDDKQSN